ncbi:glycosyltransferase family 4 protein [Mycolicibacterium phocaicum]|uniref:Colanic acid biosynthesis glycosyltransferase WcaI n=1 Tax=Mycolicibacterium phocaicum TaxID=319706 RepID=A0A7I7ZQN9_9MYCO|nr:glycosyltransferase family 4 protein [Mycolicibacterium phocaicum]TLH81061.1 colanic acid biosynthesis glycosyltransferase WcaI [Mycolicibacterium phocaicum]BBZ56390.1 glycosyltransferase WbuB [Mycolicibacterium phocaicum]
MKILIVGLNYWPETTGIAPYTTGLAEGLASRGHSVRVLTGLPHYPAWRIADEYRGSRGETAVLRNVRVKRVPHFVPSLPTAGARVHMELSFSRMAMASHWGHPDVVIAVSPALLSAAAVVAKARAARIPVGVIVQDIYSHAVVETSQMGGRAAKMTMDLESSVLRNANGVSVIHDRFAESIKKLGIREDKITVIRNWSHVDNSPTAYRSADIRREFGWCEDKVIVMHAGNMGVKQGLESVISAGRLAHRQAAERAPHFVLVGDGNRRAALQELACDVPTVQFIPPVSDDKFGALLSAADILLVNELPGIAEMAVPSKLTSYFAAGKPVLAATESRSATACEVNTSSGGVVVSGGDPEALVHGVEMLAADPALRARLGAAGQAFARRTLQPEAAIDAYEGWCGVLMGATAASAPHHIGRRLRIAAF